MNEIKLSKRLLAAANFVSQGSYVADIGTDHAYVPIYLMQKGIARGVVASDVNKGPLEKARENIEKYGFADKIHLKLTDGFDGLGEYSPNEAIICGMGGDLIQRIIDDSKYAKSTGVKLILQPMTQIYELRKYLSLGFEILDERVVFDENKLYQLICCRYDGKEHTYSDAELELGKINIKNKSKEYFMLLDFTVAKKEKVLQGLKVGGYPTDRIEKEINELKRLKNEI